MVDSRAVDLLGPAGPLRRSLEGYENRQAQLVMAEAVERALAEDNVLLCEAGTGTGKTLAYLVPAILSGRKVVVSTATKTLEDQIFTKDLPLIAHHLRLDPEAVLVKGLGNYLCLRRFHEFRQSGHVHIAQAVRSLPMVEAWVQQTLSGDVAELADMSEHDPVWREVNSSSDTRIGGSCKYYDDCFVTRMKQNSELGRLLVVNHHLFFADLALKIASARRGFAGAGVLPPYDAVIFDEAHQLEDIATQFFGVRISRARVDSMLRDADRAFVAAGLLQRTQDQGRALQLTRRVQASAEGWFGHIARAKFLSDRSNDLDEVRKHLPSEAWSGQLLKAYHDFDNDLEALCNYASANAGDEAVRLVSQRAEKLRDDAACIVDPAKNQVTWVEVRQRSVVVGASQVDLRWVFRESLFERIGAVILTSATLTTASPIPVSSQPDGGYGGHEGFGFLRSRMGLDQDIAVRVEELSIPSPFDFETQALLYTPRDLGDVTEPSFGAHAAKRIGELVGITGGGAFVLCTSVRAMNTLSEMVSRLLEQRVLVQGDAPKATLLDRFRADKNAILFATMSFWEGVDVPGSALRLVVIEKLPFAVPTDPLVSARCAAIEQEGGNSFMSYSVPQAAITLKQGFGRLIRTQTDVGIVAILDRRICIRNYGRILFESLPPTRRTESLSEVRAFWERSK